MLLKKDLPRGGTCLLPSIQMNSYWMDGLAFEKENLFPLLYTEATIYPLCIGKGWLKVKLAAGKQGKAKKELFNALLKKLAHKAMRLVS